MESPCNDGWFSSEKRTERLMDTKIEWRSIDRPNRDLLSGYPFRKKCSWWSFRSFVAWLSTMEVKYASKKSLLVFQTYITTRQLVNHTEHILSTFHFCCSWQKTTIPRQSWWTKTLNPQYADNQPVFIVPLDIYVNTASIRVWQRIPISLGIPVIFIPSDWDIFHGGTECTKRSPEGSLFLLWRPWRRPYYALLFFGQVEHIHSRLKRMATTVSWAIYLLHLWQAGIHCDFHLLSDLATLQGFHFKSPCLSPNEATFFSIGRQ